MIFFFLSHWRHSHRLFSLKWFYSLLSGFRIGSAWASAFLKVSDVILFCSLGWEWFKRKLHCGNFLRPYNFSLVKCLRVNTATIYILPPIYHQRKNQTCYFFVYTVYIIIIIIITFITLGFLIQPKSTLKAIGLHYTLFTENYCIANCSSYIVYIIWSILQFLCTCDKFLLLLPTNLDAELSPPSQSLKRIQSHLKLYS